MTTSSDRTIALLKARKLLLDMKRRPRAYFLNPVARELDAQLKGILEHLPAATDLCPEPWRVTARLNRVGGRQHASPKLFALRPAYDELKQGETT